MFIGRIGRIETEALTLSGAAPAATNKTVSGLATGRFAVEIQASGGDVYVGSRDVTAENGILIKDGTSRVFTVNRPDAVYVTGSGKAVIADYYE